MTGTFTILLALLMHPIHETIAEVEWNAESKRLEVALRLSALDQQWIARTTAKDESIARWAVRYLQRHFLIASPDPKQQAATYYWIGCEEKGSHRWWYFEIEPASGERPINITQKMFFERNENYVNRVVVLSGRRRSALTCTKSKPTAKLGSW